MAVLHGKNGKVKFSTNAIGNLDKIMVKETVPTAPSTAMGATAGTHNVGIPVWSGDIEGWYDPADANGQEAATIGASLTIGFYLQGDDSGKVYYAGTCTIVDRELSAELTANGRFKFSVEGNGALTRSTVGA